MSVIIGLSVAQTVLITAIPTILYTMFGGVQAVAWTDVKQMVLIVGTLIAAVIGLVHGLPSGVSLPDALHLVGSTGRLQVFDFRFDITNQYTFWSGTIAAFFLFCSYFGTDQSQVQRYLTTPTVDQARQSLRISAYWKIPLQALVLLVGVLMFVFYTFAPAPMLFNAVHDHDVRRGPRGAEYEALERRFEAASASRAAAAAVMVRARAAGDSGQLAAAGTQFKTSDSETQAIRNEARTLVRSATGDAAFNDVNFVFPTFITTTMPTGLVGLMIAGIFAAAMSATAGELSALSTASVIDFYRRFVRPEATDRHFLMVSRCATAFWGILASIVAVYAAELGSLIEVVNRFGSYFYGSILGVFILAIGFRRATSNGAFIALFAGMSSVAYLIAFTRVAFLWHNLIAAVVVVAVGLLVSAIDPFRKAAA
jgi:Na+/proline symporter